MRKWTVEERETINKASPRNVQEGGGREGGWESSDVTDLRATGQEDGHMEEVSASSFLHSPYDDPFAHPAIAFSLL